MAQSKLAQEFSVLHSTDGVIDLFALDNRSLGGQVYHFSPQCRVDGSSARFWSPVTNTIVDYTLMPCGIDSIDSTAMSKSLPQPVLNVAVLNNNFLLTEIVTLGDITGAKVWHLKTMARYLDGQPGANMNKYTGPQRWYIFQLTLMTNQMVQWALANQLDRPGLMLPARQILKDEGINPGHSVYFPGVTPYQNV